MDTTVTINRKKKRNKVELPSNFVEIYSVGHFFKDVCQTIWYSYMTLFLVNVTGLPTFDAALLMTVGQIANIIGTKMSKDSKSSAVTSHGIGFVLAAMSFVLIFFPYSEHNTEWDGSPKRFESFIFHGGLIFVFQIGCAFMQLTHIVAVPYTIKKQEERQQVVAYRFLLQSSGKGFVYAMVWLVLTFTDVQREKPILIHADVFGFLCVASGLTSGAIIMYCIFHNKIMNYSEKEQVALELIPRKPSDTGRRIKIDQNALDFLRAVVYSFIKLHYLCVLMFFPLWIDERELTAYKMGETEAQMHGIQIEYEPFDTPGSGGIMTVALVPMTMSIFFAITAKFLIKYRLSVIHYMNVGLVGIMLCLSAAFYVFYLHPTMSPLHLYVIAILLGVGNAAAQITSGSKVAKIIHQYRGQKTHTMVCFLDKILIIIPILLVGYYKCEVHSECPYYYHQAFNPMLFSIPLVSLCGALVLYIAYLCGIK